MSHGHDGSGAHAVERLQDLLDGRLSAADAAGLQAHIDDCAVCKAEWDRLSAGRASAHRLKAERELPADLEASLVSLLDEEDRRVGLADHADQSSRASLRPPARRPRSGRWVMGLAAAAALVMATIWWTGRGGDLPSSAARHYEQLVDGRLALGLATSRPADLEAHFARSNAPRVRVLDLGMMGFSLQGGRVHAIDDRPSALYVYRSGGGEQLVCEMYGGTLAELPRADDVRQNGAFTFHVFRRGTLTLVFWQEGSIVCVLVSSLPSADVLQLAMAKAMLPA